MKKLAALVLTILLTLSAHTQTSKDSIRPCPTDAQLRIALQLVEQGRFCEKQRDALEQEVNLLDRQLAQKDTTISILDKRVAVKESLEKTYIMEQRVSDAENAALIKKNEDDKKAAAKDLKKQKDKTVLYKITTVVAIAAGAYLLLKP